MAASVVGSREEILRMWPQCATDTSTAQELVRASYEFQKELPHHIQTCRSLERLCSYVPSTSQQDDSTTVSVSTSGEGILSSEYDVECDDITDEQIKQLQMQRTVLSFLARGLPVPQEAMRGIVSTVTNTEVSLYLWILLPCWQT